MGLALYVFFAVTAVLVLAWAVYVLPVPGPLSPLELSVGLLPVFVILGAVLLSFVALWLVAFAIRAALRQWRRAR